MVNLGNVAEIAAGGGAPQNKSDFSKSGRPFLRAGSLPMLLTGKPESQLEQLSDESAQKHRLRLFPKDTIVFAKSGMSATKGHIYQLKQPCFVVNHLAAIIPSASLFASYLKYLLQIHSPSKLIKDEAYPSIRLSDISDLKIPLPPLAEQRRIAEILDRADALREKRRKSIAMINELRQSVFETFVQTENTDKSTITLGEIAEDSRGAFVNGPFGSDLLTSELQSFGVPVIYIRDIRNGEYNRVSESHVSFEKAYQLEICAVKSGDVLVAKVGDPPGITAIYPAREPDGIITQDVIRIRINRKIATPEFLASYLNSPVGRWKIKKITVEATRARFSLRDFKQLQIEIPSINKQIQFSKIYHSLDNLISKHRSSLNKLDELFHSLQHRAFNG